jgi:hypothetical protein
MNKADCITKLLLEIMITLRVVISEVVEFKG